MWAVLLSAIGGYLLGSLSFARVVMKLVAPGEEIDGMDFEVAGREEKIHYGAVSGTAVSMKLGAKWGGITALLDIFKVALPTLVSRLVSPGQPYYLIVAAGGVVGHVWPIYYRFKGGRGLSPIYGGLLVFDFVGSLVTAIVGMLFSMFVLKNILISYMAGLWLMIPWVWFWTRDVSKLAFVVFCNVMFVVAMIPDIRQMAALKRSGLDADFEESMQSMPQTRMMMKMARRLGMMKED